ncbi:recombinase RecT [Cupriavidus sp. AcVe19-6a]|uniref:recombinase RecT n=1 Tax=Cupriavidus sp. AcVe19-6a TaxID=2821358 RepID=UPI001AEA471C|nr:recombinase RecT [Cupriavidus sp. AcVe19-6a]MBP0634881.1 recombinase RecT [Cupriavidus sp. AcVe19-6a]
MSEEQLPAVPAQDLPTAQITRYQVNPIEKMRLALEYGRMMATSRGVVPRAFEGNEGTCTAIAEQAITWNMSPNALAQMAYCNEKTGRLGYEGKAIAAACYTTGATTDPLDFEPIGDWSVLHGFQPESAGQGKGGGEKLQRGWPPELEQGLGIRVTGTLATNLKSYTIDVYLETIAVRNRNSPLWVTNPYAQMIYQGATQWARQRAPFVLAGVQVGGDHRDARDMGAAEVISAHGAEMTPQERLDTALAPVKARIEGTAPPPPLTEVLTAFSKASSRNEMEHALQLAALLPEGIDKEKARAAYAARLAELKGQPAPGSEPASAEPSSSEPATPAPGDGGELEPPTYAQVRDQLQNARTVDDLDTAADLIGSVENPQHREELVEIYRELQAKHE